MSGMARPGHGQGDELVLPLTGTVIMRGDNVAAVSPVRTRARACVRARARVTGSCQSGVRVPGE
jgi:hypothetical protein